MKTATARRFNLDLALATANALQDRLVQLRVANAAAKQGPQPRGSIALLVSRRQESWSRVAMEVIQRVDASVAWRMESLARRVAQSDAAAAKKARRRVAARVVQRQQKAAKRRTGEAARLRKAASSARCHVKGAERK
jgi:hypothetical protein